MGVPQHLGDLADQAEPFVETPRRAVGSEDVRQRARGGVVLEDERGTGVRHEVVQRADDAVVVDALGEE